MASNTPIVIAIVIAIILVGVAAYYIATRSSTTVTTTLPPTTVSTVTTSISTTVSTTTTSTSTTTTSTTSTTTTSSLPPGAIALPYDASNHTVFLYLAALSTGNVFNFNGTSFGKMHVYIPAGWTVIVYFTNEESGLPHNLLIVQNDTATPNSSDVGNDGKILLYVGTTPSSYTANGLISGQSASGSITLQPGYYWFCCGIAGHAVAGMWGVIIVSSSITVPYATT
ncbi:probable sulfocyanin [Sulfurisphaera tokodaii str. 7]|uniref:Sulfocyanin n=3 Tax=Sulfurisphaera tokodaii TaxID=111955 RepID=F9VPE9_SULTO|nr:sulfocyanin [Sulfurisphaera tokodaii]BAK54796.1 probable sulfocyanin [Sulfurisphaera tokodaii str. 7]